MSEIFAVARVYKVFKKDEPDGHRYIGSSSDSLEHRLALHKSEARHRRPYKLYDYMALHGPDNFDIIELEEIENVSECDLLIIEQKYIDEYDSVNGPLGLNGKNAIRGCSHGKDRRDCRDCKVLGIGGSRLCDIHPDHKKDSCSICKNGSAYCPCGSGKVKVRCNAPGCNYGASGICHDESHRESTDKPRGKKEECPVCNPCLICPSKKNAKFPHPANTSKHRKTGAHIRNVTADVSTNTTTSQKIMAV